MAQVIQAPPDTDTEERVNVPQLAAWLAAPERFAEGERLVGIVSSRYARWAQTLEYEEIRQAAYLGLVLAAKRYDASRGAPFFSFAWHSIAGEIRHLIRIWMREHRRFGNLISLEGRHDEDGEDMARERDFVLPYALPIDERVAIRGAVDRLPRLHRAVITHLFFMHLTQTETARELGYSQKHVSRLMHEALRELRKTFGGTNPRKKMRGRHSQEQKPKA